MALRVHGRRQQKQTIGTLRGYLPQIRLFLQVCLACKYYPIPGPFPPMLMCYYLEFQMDKHNNSIQSYKTWESAIKWLGKAINGDDGSSWYTHPDYRTHRDVLKKQYYRPAKNKLPLYVSHLTKYARHYDIRPGHFEDIPYDRLLNFLYVALCFVTFSRPCELLNQPADKFKCGLRIKDCKLVESEGKIYYKIIIRHFKNQRFRGEPKEIWLGDAWCGREKCACGCRYLNPFWLLGFVLRRRRRIIEEGPISGERLRALSLDDDAKLFVRFDGSEMLTTQTKSLVHHIVIFNKILEVSLYSDYSMRVGGTTQASAAVIPDGFQYAWVGWSKEKLPDAAKGYCRPSHEDMLLMPFYLLHGFTATKDKCTPPPAHVPAMIRDLWAELSR